MKYISPTKAMRHQKEALHRRTLRPRGYDDVFADLQEMGAGKSKTILDEFQAMLSANTIDDLLVVAPAGSIRNWYRDKTADEPSELNRHLDPRLLKILRVAGWTAKKQHRDEVRALVHRLDRPRALFINVEAISTSEEVVKLCKMFMLKRRVMFVIDESTTIRASKANRTKIIVQELRQLATARRILTGLVTPKSPMDLYWQYYFLDPRIIGHDTFTTFRARYAKVQRTCFEPNKIVRDRLRSAMGLKIANASISFLQKRLEIVYDGKRKIPSTMQMREVRTELEVAAEGMSRDDAVECILRLGSWIKNSPKIVEFRNLEELQKKIAPFSYRVLKEDCMDIPPRVYVPRDVEMTKEQKTMYDDLVAKAITEFEGKHVVTKTVIAKLRRLHQVTVGHCADEEKKTFDVPSNRLDALQDLLEDHSGAAIIWSAYRREIDKIAAHLRKIFGPRSVAEFHGGNRGERESDERRFLGDDPECRFMVSTQAAGGKGNTWTRADLTVYCANSFDLEHRLQSEDRNHRKGQKKSVTYVDLICRGTVEEKIVASLRKKIDLATVVTGDNYREWLI